MTSSKRAVAGGGGGRPAERSRAQWQPAIKGTERAREASQGHGRGGPAVSKPGGDRHGAASGPRAAHAHAWEPPAGVGGARGRGRTGGRSHVHAMATGSRAGGGAGPAAVATGRSDSGGRRVGAVDRRPRGRCALTHVRAAAAAAALKAYRGRRTCSCGCRRRSAVGAHVDDGPVDVRAAAPPGAALVPVPPVMRRLTPSSDNCRTAPTWSICACVLPRVRPTERPPRGARPLVFPCL